MTTDFVSDPRRTILASVKRPARYIGGEIGSGPVKEGSNLVRICYAFPDVYEIGMSYLGYQILYHLTKELDYADAERVYTPWPDMEEALRRENIPLWALESKRPIHDFDVFAITLQYELSYTNMLTLLDLGGIPLRAENRTDSDPLVIGGGQGTLAPAPITPFFDAFCIGDGEIIIPEMLKSIQETKGQPRHRRLEALAKVPGMYVPSVPQEYPVRRRILENLDEGFYHKDMIVPNTGIVHDRIAVQVFKGCTRGCRFCQAGIIDRPVRERSAESVVNQIETIIEKTGWEEVGLLSLATCDWSQLNRTFELLAPVLEQEKVKLSLPSLRVDAFSVDLAVQLQTLRKSGLTFAPEAGTQRLRNVINKGVTEEDIEKALEATFANGWDRVKLYFMMGLPTETDEDLDGIIEICNMARHIARTHKRKGLVSASVAGFVPKAHTPFQWEPQADREYLKEKGRWLKSSIKSRKISLSYHEPEQTYLEGVFARGDARLADAIEEVWRRGERFDGWSEYFNFDRWMQTFADLGIDPDYYTVRKRELDEILPWDIINSGVSKEFLLRERAKAMSETITRDCRLGCNACGWQNKTSVKGCNNA